MMATRWGIVSAGLICSDFVAALTNLPRCDHQVVAVAATSLARAEEFAASRKIPKAYGSYKQMAADKDIDVMYIGCRDAEHLPVCEMMMRSGHNVLCEKPMGMNLREVKEMCDVAKQNNVFFMEGLWSRFFPAHLRLRKELDADVIGEPRYVRITFGLSGPNSDRRKMGAIQSMACYPLAMCNFVFKDTPQKISADSEFSDYGADVTTIVNMKYSRGRMAQFIVAWHIKMSQEAEISGYKGSIKVPDFWHPTKLILPTGDIVFPMRTAGNAMNFIGSDGLQYEAQGVRECILRGEKECALFTHDDSRALATISDEIKRQVGLVQNVSSRP